MADEAASMDIAGLVADHHQAVYTYAYRLAGSVPEAEDLTQQVFLVAQQKLGQLRKTGSARGWLFTILRNHFLKTRQRPRPVPAANLQLNIDTIPADPPEDEDIDRQALQRGLDQLPAKFRVVLVMYYYEDLAYREIAEKLNLPIGTVMSRLARAKGHLRAKLIEPSRPRTEQPTPAP
jgi:RNA polymerase sigma-70 factor (ECF subfamily)